MSVKTEKISSTFVRRRLHSLLGLWLVIYLMEHLFVNSQAALWIGDDGVGFVRLVNAIQNLPYLYAIEIVLLGVPILLHAWWGVKILWRAKFNVQKGDGSKPSLGEYGRNHAFTWQRLTSWVLLVGIILHVVQMRFLDAPEKVVRNNRAEFLVKLHHDEGLYTLAPRLGVSLYNQDKIGEITQKFSLTDHQVVAAAPTPGAAMLLALRDTFKSPLMGVLYTIFVLAAAFHAFNGFWTFLLTWGAILSMRSQRSMVNVSFGVMAVFLFLGLASIWGSYWINLRS